MGVCQEPLIFEVFNKYENVNIFVDRPSTYFDIGRNQDHDELIDIDERISKMLDDKNIDYLSVSHSIHPKDLLYKILKEILT